MKQITDDTLKGLKQVGVETGKEFVKQVGKIAESVITGKELLGDITSMSQAEMKNKHQEDEIKKQQEMARLKSEIGQERPRDVEGEIELIRKQRENEEEEQERLFLENLKRQREAERAEMGAFVEEPSKKRSRGDAFASNKKVKQSSMSATKEYDNKTD